VAPTLIDWVNKPVQVGTLAGTFSTAASVATGNGASGSAFTYGEVGYFSFKAQGVYDSTFTSAYQDASDTVCVNTSPNDFSNTPDSSGKVGCKFGNTAATNHLGRFVPDHFDTVVTQACATGAFSYSGQPFSVTVTARNVAGGATLNYHGASYGKAVTLSARNSGDTAANPGPGAFIANSNLIAASVFANGAATTAAPAYAFTSATTVPNVLRVRASDTDGVTSLRTAPATTVEGTTTVRSGRLWLNNAYGSELLPLLVPVRTQYWGANGWATNTADSCTALTVPSNANTGLTNALKAKTTASLGVPTVAAGIALLGLTAPGGGNVGLVDVSGTILRGVSSWLTLSAPSARACFGSCGPRSPVIYFRESF
jgi:MSHA biogenesis protein MshQ